MQEIYRCNTPTPTNITDVHSWFDLINQVSYAFAATERLLPFCKLLKPGTPFKWDSALDQIFKESKSVIISEINKGICIFHKSNGLEMESQKHCNCPSTEPFCCCTGWRITLVGSCFTHAAESCYAPVEGEALVVADALDKTRFFSLGCNDLIITVDHKPLLKILGDRSLEDIPNARLPNLKERTLRHIFRMIHIPGVRHKAADAVSCHPRGPPNPDMLVLPDDIATTSDLTTSFPLNELGCSFLSGIHSKETPTQPNHRRLARIISLVNQKHNCDHMGKSETCNHKDESIIESGFPEFRHELLPISP